LIDLFISPIEVDDKDPSLQSLGQVLEQLVIEKIKNVDAVRLTLPKQLPDLAKRLDNFGKLEDLDRLKLIDIKNQTGVDGVIQMRCSREEKQLKLDIKLVDLKNGRVVLKKTYLQAVSADLFSSIENDINHFARNIRQSIRVTIHITSNPEDSQVYINDKLVGKTPLTHEARTGDFTIKVAKQGYKPFITNHQLVDGQELTVQAVLYNPIATRFLNAPPGLWVDSRQLNTGYRYVFLNSSNPDLDHAHFFTVSGALRINDFEIGVGVATTSMVSTQQLDTFLGEKQGNFDLDHRLLQIFASFKYPIWEKYSFANLKAGLQGGVTYASVESSAKDSGKWTGCMDAFVEMEVRMVRSGNFSMDLTLALGLAYLGEIEIIDKTFSLFGEGPETIRNKHMLGPMGSVGLQLKWYNDIF
jgi:hypothetical protein